MYSFNLIWTKPLRKKFGGKIWIFAKVILKKSLKLGFWTNMESNAAVMLHFEDLAV